MRSGLCAGMTLIWVYIYINYGRYPYEADGTVAPILWRVLGIDEDGYALLLTEYVIDFAMISREKSDH